MIWKMAKSATASVTIPSAHSPSFSQRGQLQIMFGIRGERHLAERELGWLTGWRDSSPVRVGNAAWEQPQLDVYGELLDAIHRLKDQIPDPEPEERQFLIGLADAAMRVWNESDHGIWELCTFWLAHALALAGRVDEARRVFERATGYGNDLGLFSEEVDTETGGLIGNFPQAFSHVGLANAAWAIGDAEASRDSVSTLAVDGHSIFELRWVAIALLGCPISVTARPSSGAPHLRLRRPGRWLLCGESGRRW